MQRDLIQTMLEHLGYEVNTALDGERAVELYSEAIKAGRDYDAVILDLTVKVGMDGREAIRKLPLPQSGSQGDRIERALHRSDNARLRQLRLLRRFEKAVRS